jgi:tRNA 2-thiouridine synthesizing protein C
MATTLFVIKRPPFGDRPAREALEAILAFAAFDQPIAILFMDDGVLHLLPNQDGSNIGHRPVSQLLSALPIYGVEKIYACQKSLSLHGIEPTQLALAPELVTDTQLGDHIASYQHIIGL